MVFDNSPQSSGSPIGPAWSRAIRQAWSTEIMPGSLMPSAGGNQPALENAGGRFAILARSRPGTGTGLADSGLEKMTRRVSPGQVLSVGALVLVVIAIKCTPSRYDPGAGLTRVKSPAGLPPPTDARSAKQNYPPSASRTIQATQARTEKPTRIGHLAVVLTHGGNSMPCLASVDRRAQPARTMTRSSTVLTYLFGRPLPAGSGDKGSHMRCYRRQLEHRTKSHPVTNDWSGCGQHTGQATCATFLEDPDP